MELANLTDLIAGKSDGSICTFVDSDQVIGESLRFLAVG